MEATSSSRTLQDGQVSEAEARKWHNSRILVNAFGCWVRVAFVVNVLPNASYSIDDEACLLLAKSALLRFRIRAKLLSINAQSERKQHALAYWNFSYSSMYSAFLRLLSHSKLCFGDLNKYSKIFNSSGIDGF